MAITAEQLSAIDDVVPEKGSYSPKVRVLFLIDEIGRLDGGGTERQILQLILLSKRLGYEPRLAVLRGNEWLREESVGCPVYSGRRAEPVSSFGMARLLGIGSVDAPRTDLSGADLFC